jgi:hypothetical protein
MEKITIGFSRPRNIHIPFVSWLIRLYQGWTPYSHTYLEFYSETINRALIYEAVGKGTRFISQPKWQEYAVEVDSFTLDIKKCNYIEILQYCVDNQGNNYGHLQNIGIVIANLFGWKKNPFTSGRNCSEEIGRILLLENFKIDKDLNLLTTEDIYNVLKSQARK